MPTIDTGEVNSCGSRQAARERERERDSWWCKERRACAGNLIWHRFRARQIEFVLWSSGLVMTLLCLYGASQASSSSPSLGHQLSTCAAIATLPNIYIYIHSRTHQPSRCNGWNWKVTICICGAWTVRKVKFETFLRVGENENGLGMKFWEI